MDEYVDRDGWYTNDNICRFVDHTETSVQRRSKSTLTITISNEQLLAWFDGGGHERFAAADDWNHDSESSRKSTLANNYGDMIVRGDRGNISRENSGLNDLVAGMQRDEKDGTILLFENPSNRGEDHGEQLGSSDWSLINQSQITAENSTTDEQGLSYEHGATFNSKLSSNRHKKEHQATNTADRNLLSGGKQEDILLSREVFATEEQPEGLSDDWARLSSDSIVNKEQALLGQVSQVNKREVEERQRGGSDRKHCDSLADDMKNGNSTETSWVQYGDQNESTTNVLSVGSTALLNKEKDQQSYYKNQGESTADPDELIQQQQKWQQEQQQKKQHSQGETDDFAKQRQVERDDILDDEDARKLTASDANWHLLTESESRPHGRDLEKDSSRKSGLTPSSVSGATERDDLFDTATEKTKNTSNFTKDQESESIRCSLASGAQNKSPTVHGQNGNNESNGMSNFDEDLTKKRKKKYDELGAGSVSLVDSMSTQPDVVSEKDFWHRVQQNSLTVGAVVAGLVVITMVIIVARK